MCIALAGGLGSRPSAPCRSARHAQRCSCPLLASRSQTLCTRLGLISAQRAPIRVMDRDPALRTWRMHRISCCSSHLAGLPPINGGRTPNICLGRREGLSWLCASACYRMCAGRCGLFVLATIRQLTVTAASIDASRGNRNNLHGPELSNTMLTNRYERFRFYGHLRSIGLSAPDDHGSGTRA
jgi:hypothetical protein